MKHPENAQSELRELYYSARKQGKAHTQKEFAELVGIHPANMSQFMSGSAPLTNQMLRRIKDAAAARGIVFNQDCEDNVAAVTESGDIFGGHAQKNLQSSDPQWFELVARKDDQIAQKDEQINRLLSIIENMQK